MVLIWFVHGPAFMTFLCEETFAVWTRGMDMYRLYHAFFLLFTIQSSVNIFEKKTHSHDLKLNISHMHSSIRTRTSILSQSKPQVFYFWSLSQSFKLVTKKCCFFFNFSLPKWQISYNFIQELPSLRNIGNFL